MVKPSAAAPPGELGHHVSSWPAVASTWLGTGSCRSPTVEVLVGSRSRSWVGTGTKGWGFALYDPATETYEPAVLPGGQRFGSAVEAYDTAAIVHLTEYAE
jgi:hypothetical protein